jgi:hypothetical protein
VLLPKIQKRVYTEDSIFIKKNWFCRNSGILCKMTPLKACLPFRHWNNLALIFSHVINMYLALLVHFSFKRISCLKSLKSSWCNRLFSCFTLKSYTISLGSLLFSFFPNIQWSNVIKWCSQFMKANLHDHFRTCVSWNTIYLAFDLHLWYWWVRGQCLWSFWVSNDSSIYKNFFHSHKNTQTNTLHFKSKLLSS